MHPPHIRHISESFSKIKVVEVVVYIFRHLNYHIFTEFNKNNNEEERSSGTTRTGVSQNDLQIKKEEEKR